MLTAENIFNQGKVIPVIVIENLDDALPLSRAILDGGIKVLEITLRTSVALDAIKLISKNLPEAIVGAGTVIDDIQLVQAVENGAKFIISPGLGHKLVAGAKKSNIPIIVGIATISEMMNAKDLLGINHFKFFPAESSGGIKALKSFHGPFPNVKFCPTGGINEKNYQDYLALPNVACVGGSWIVPQKFIKEKNWSAITNLCKQI